MKTRWILPLLALPLLGCPTAPVDDDDATEPDGPTWEALPADLQSTFATEADLLGATGAAVAIWHDGTLYAGTVGTTSPDGDLAVAPTTLFRIGSTTKVMTSVAMLAAADRGQLAMTDRVVDHIAGLDIAGDGFADVQLHHLLSQTSGISEITPLNGSSNDDLLQSFTTSSVGFAGQTYMMAPAGSFWNYSNPNFALAGAVTEIADGRIYRDLMREDVFRPLAMDRTFFLGEDVADDGDFAESETWDWDDPASGERRLASAESYDHAWSRPAGFAWSNVLDMVQFGRFLIDGDTDVISASSHAQLVADQVDTLAYLDYLAYGYGVMNWRENAAAGDWYTVSTTEHGGAIPGYAAEFITVPAADLVMVTLAAGDGAYFDELKAAVFEQLLGADPTAVPDPQVDTDLTRFVGTYEDPFNIGTAIVSVDGDGDLQWELPLLDDNDIPYEPELVASSKSTFAANIQGNWTNLSFVGSDGTNEGEARWIRHRAFVADRFGVVTRQAPSRDRLQATLARMAAPQLE